MNYEENLRNLRNKISFDSTRDDTCFIQIESSLWRMCQRTLLEDELHKGKELSFVNLGNHLSNALRNANYEDIGALAEGSICSFFPIVRVEEIASRFGYESNWQLLENECKLKYFQLRFVSSYWFAVRDMAIRSKMECISYFCLDEEIVDTLASASPNNIMDFCHGHASIHNFKLRCSQKDCLSILEIMKREDVSEESRQMLLATAKLRKSNHCTIFDVSDR